MKARPPPSAGRRRRACSRRFEISSLVQKCFSAIPLLPLINLVAVALAALTVIADSVENCTGNVFESTSISASLTTMREPLYWLQVHHLKLASLAPSELEIRTAQLADSARDQHGYQKPAGLSAGLPGVGVR